MNPRRRYAHTYGAPLQSEMITAFSQPAVDHAGPHADATPAPTLTAASLLFLPVTHRQYRSTGVSIVGDEGVE